MERVASRQRRLAQAAHNSAYERYVQFFDPLIVLLQERLRAGDAQDAVQSRRLNGLVTGLSVEQKQAAKDAGLTGCNVDFPDTVTRAAFGSPANEHSRQPLCGATGARTWSRRLRFIRGSR